MAAVELRTHSDRGRRIALAALLAVGGFGVAACGGSGSHASTRLEAVAPGSSAVTARPAPAATIEQTTATVARKATAKAKNTTPAGRPGKTSSTTATASPTTHPTSPPTTTSTEKTTPHRRYSSPHTITSTPHASPAQSHRVLACLARAGLTHVSAGTRVVWSGYTATTGTFVYVYLYRSNAAAVARAHALSAEEVAVARRYLISQSIAPYRGSPVPAVTVCLGGKAPKQPPGTKKPGSFQF